MPQFKTSKEIFTECQRDGIIVGQEEIDPAKIGHMISLAMADLRATKQLAPLTKDPYEWSVLYKMYYDAFHELAEAFLRLNRLKCSNHQCLFAYLCEKHPELELSWNILEKARTKRNGILYYGKPVTKEDWKEIELPIKIYISTLKKAVEEKLKT